MGGGSSGRVTAPKDTPWHLWPGAPEPGTFLCDMETIPDPGAKGFVFGEGARQFDMFVVRKDGVLAAYVNSCPHIGTPLEFMKDKFLNADSSLIVCSTHGAQFRLQDGFCVKGPCRDSSLQRVPLDLDGTDIRIATE